MKTLMLFLLFMGAVSCNSTKDDAASRMQHKIAQEKKEQEKKVKSFSKDANFKTATIAIEGMSCKINCATKIEKNLNKMDGVKIAIVDFDNKKATVIFDSNSVVNADFIKTITETNKKVADYKVTAITVE